MNRSPLSASVLLQHFLKPPILAATLLIVLNGGLQLLGPYLTGLAIDRHILAGQRTGFLGLMLVLLGVYLAIWLTRALAAWLLTRAGQGLLYTLRTELFARLQVLPLSFFDAHASGDLMARLLDDSETIQTLLNEGLAQAFSQLLLALGMLGAMAWLQPRLTLAVLTLAPLLFLWSGWLLPRLQQAYQRVRELAGRLEAELQEELSQIRLVQAFAQEAQMQTRMEQLTQESVTANLSAQRWSVLLNVAPALLSTVGTALVLWLGAQAIQQDAMSLGQLVTFLGYERRFFPLLQGLLGLASYRQQAQVAWRRLQPLWETPAEAQPANPLPLPHLRGELRFDDVSFAYAETPVLSHVSFCVAPGQRVAIVGPTGVGKTTLINLLMRFYTPQQGRILLDGYDVSTVDANALRRQIGLVLQEPVLFAGSILDNLRYARSDVTEEEIAALLRELGADDWLRSLPEGYNTRIGERGVTLSQGQKQLLAIARTLLARPRLLVLDEAIAALDRQTERLIHQALARLMEGRTTLLIAHRLSSVKDADWIVVLREGRIVEQGTHADLLAARGWYWQAWQAGGGSGRPAQA